MMTIAPTRTHRQAGHRIIGNPRLVRYLFETTRSAWLWTIVRVYLGWQWLKAGWGKVQNDAWMVHGGALKDFLDGALERTPYGWYATFLEWLRDSGNYVWFAKFVAVGEVLVGIALILGVLTGFAAFGGALMNFNFMLAGTVSTNPVMFLLAALLMLAWKVAGHYGVDYWLLPALGTPWEPDLGPGTRNKAETVKEDG